MHGQISGGGIGFCHRNYRRDLSAGCCGAKRQHRGGEGKAVGGQLPRRDNQARTRGAPKTVLQVPASSLEWGISLVAHVTPCCCAGLGPWWDSC